MTAPARRPLRSVLITLAVAAAVTACGVEPGTPVGAPDGTTSTTACTPTTRAGGTGGVLGTGGDDCDPPVVPTVPDGSTTSSSPVTTIPAGPDADEYIDALVAAYGAAGGLQGTGINARCLAGTWVDHLGADTLHSAEIAPDDLRSDGPAALLPAIDAQGQLDLAGYLTDCGGDAASLLEDIIEEAEFPAETRPCMAEQLGEGFAVRTFAAVIFDRTDAFLADAHTEAKVTAALDACA